MKVDRPIFVVGSGRSGSSFFATLLSRHPKLTFPTRLNERYPRSHGYNRLQMRFRSVPGLQGFLRDRFPISEAYRFWDTHAPGFSEPTRDLTADDVTRRTEKAVRDAVRGNLVSGRPRFLAKLTGWGRIGYLNQVFPDAHFIHLVRDGRDVANSLLAVDFWQGWRGPQNWRFGELPDDLRAEWERHDRSFVALAGLCWRLLVDSVEEARRELPRGRFSEIRYEDLVDDPVAIFREVVQSCDLERSDDFLRDIGTETVRDASGKHRRDLTERQQEILTQVTRDTRARYGYT